MTPAMFAECNSKLRGPTPEIADLYVFKDGEQIISMWRMSWRERFAALFFGRVWLHVASIETHPPVGLSCARTIFSPIDKGLPF